MSRTAAKYKMVWTRGTTAEDDFTYVDENDAAIDLSGYSAVMHVRPEDAQFGVTTADTLLLELTTANGLLKWDTAADGHLRIVVPPLDMAALNPNNEDRVIYAFSINVFLPPASGDPEYVIPLVTGKLAVLGTVIR